MLYVRLIDSLSRIVISGKFVVDVLFQGQKIIVDFNLNSNLLKANFCSFEIDYLLVLLLNINDKRLLLNFWKGNEKDRFLKLENWRRIRI